MISADEIQGIRAAVGSNLPKLAAIALHPKLQFVPQSTRVWLHPLLTVGLGICERLDRLIKYEERTAVNAFTMTPQRRRDKRDWPSWLLEARDRDSSEVGAVWCYPTPPDDTLFLTVANGRFLTIEWQDRLVLHSDGSIALQSRPPFRTS